MRCRLLYIALLLLAERPLSATASHMNGGELTYTYLGNSQYRIALRLYSDCLHGDPQAITQDDPANINIFYGKGTLFSKDRIPGVQTGQVPYLSATGSCFRDNAAACLSFKDYAWQVTLPPNTSGYKIVYERCCLVDDVKNVPNPDAYGFRFEADVPPAFISGVTNAYQNSTPAFTQFPPVRVCANKLFDLDFSAKDPDGDSLTYELGPALRGGDPSQPLPDPAFTGQGTLPYIGGYSIKMPFGASGNLAFDPSTGKAVGYMGRQGGYLVAVHVREWRNGQLLASTPGPISWILWTATS